MDDSFSGVEYNEEDFQSNSSFDGQDSSFESSSFEEGEDDYDEENNPNNPNPQVEIIYTREPELGEDGEPKYTRRLVIRRGLSYVSENGEELEDDIEVLEQHIREIFGIGFDEEEE